MSTAVFASRLLGQSQKARPVPIHAAWDGKLHVIQHQRSWTSSFDVDPKASRNPVNIYGDDEAGPLLQSRGTRQGLLFVLKRCCQVGTSVG